MRGRLSSGLGLQVRDALCGLVNCFAVISMTRGDRGHDDVIGASMRWSFVMWVDAVGYVSPADLILNGWLRYLLTRICGLENMRHGFRQGADRCPKHREVSERPIAPLHGTCH